MKTPIYPMRLQPEARKMCEAKKKKYGSISAYIHYLIKKDNQL